MRHRRGAFCRHRAAAATAPALILVGSLMLSTISEIRWHQPLVAVPAFLTMVLIPLLIQSPTASASASSRGPFFTSPPGNSVVRNGCSTCWPRCFWRASSISELTEACSRARAVRVIQQVQDCRQVYAYFSTVKQRGYCLSLGDLYGQNAILCLISGSILFSPRGACDSHNFSVQRFRKRP